MRTLQNNNGSPPAKALKADKSLSPEQEEPKRMFPCINMGWSWMNALAAEFNKDYFKELMNFVQLERQLFPIYPKESDVYSWTKHCDINEIKVVIIGQDPYHQPGQAHGLCFSVPNGVAPPPSLVNIYKELSQEIGGFTIPNHGNLTGWAKQGVLLLNACLTVRDSQPNSHKNKGWELFTDAVIEWINLNSYNVVFLLWGCYAQKKGACINQGKHCVLASAHPSPLSAHLGFFGCNHFSKANEYLQRTQQNPINWAVLPQNA